MRAFKPAEFIDLLEPLSALAMMMIVGLLSVAVSGMSPGRNAVAPAPLAARDLQFTDRADGAVEVYDTNERRVIDVVAPGSNGFIRGTLRGLARERKRQGIGREVPFRLTALADGRLTLEDPATRRVIDLEAFGHTNAEAFARLLAAGRGEAPARVATIPKQS